MFLCSEEYFLCSEEKNQWSERDRVPKKNISKKKISHFSRPCAAGGKKYPYAAGGVTCAIHASR